MKKKASLSLKLIMGFLSVALITVSIGTLGCYSNNLAGKEIANLGDNAIPAIAYLEKVSLSLMKIRIALRSLMAPWLEPADIQRQFDNIDSARLEYQTALSNYNLLARTEEEEKLYQVLLEKIAISKADNNALIELSRKTSCSGSRSERDFLRRVLRQLLRQCPPVLLRYACCKRRSSQLRHGPLRERRGRTGEVTIRQNERYHDRGSTLGLVVALIIGIVMSRSISASIKRTQPTWSVRPKASKARRRRFPPPGRNCPAARPSSLHPSRK
jgi:hypothetical protein